MLTLFWVFLFVVFYTYLGYGILLYILVRIKRLLCVKKTQLTFKEWPDVTLLICAYNEEDIVEQKMKNCYSLKYPKDKLHIVWVTDGSTDSTNEKLSKYNDVQVLFSAPRLGKSAALNRAIPLLHSPFIAFTDANTFLNEEAIVELISPFADERVGCVSGEKRIFVQRGDGLAAEGEGLYWKYESFLKKLDSELYSTMGAAGELFAIRAELFEQVDLDMLLDDFIMSMKIVKRGYKIAYSDTAYACETGSFSIDEEEKRKKRIAAGGLQSIFALREMMNPFKYGIVSFQLISHRFLRWSITPIMLFSLLFINFYLSLNRQGYIYDIALLFQLLFYLMVLLKVKVPYYFFFMNLNVFKGVLYLYRKKQGTGAWEKAKRASSSGNF